MKIFYIILLALVTVHVLAQDSQSISKIREQRLFVNTENYVTTTGIVTAKFDGNSKINGFYLQDTSPNNAIGLSSGIFVNSIIDSLQVGDKVELVAKVNESLGKIQIESPKSIHILSRNNTVTATKVKYNPATFNWAQYDGMLLEFDQTLYVNSNRNLERYGELELGDVRKPSPTNTVFPGTAEYDALVNKNSITHLYLDDNISSSYNKPIVFADANGTRRSGERVKNLQGIVDYTGGKYVVYPANLPVNFYGNARTTTPSELGSYNLKVCGFNLEYYLTTPNSSGMGPATQTEMDNQHTKIIAALKAIDADIYGLVEIEQGQDALTKLASALTSSTGKSYSFVNDGGSVNGTYTKVGYLYRSDRVSPYLQLKNINAPGPTNRKKMQAFTLKSNGEKFIFSINHFKAKSGCSSATGNDADQRDGQSCYNATRTAEAEAVIELANTNKSYYNDQDVLVMGDLNAYAKEDPVQSFVQAGYKDLHQYFHPDTAYSYVYNGETGYLDHALATESMTQQITGVSVFHINSDEPSMFEYSGSNYQPNMYRCSDHDPVVVGIYLDIKSSNGYTFDEKVKMYPTIIDSQVTIERANNAYVQFYSLSGVKVYETRLRSDKEVLSVDTIGLPIGMYIVRMLGEGEIARRIIVVK